MLCKISQKMLFCYILTQASICSETDEYSRLVLDIKLHLNSSQHLL